MIKVLKGVISFSLKNKYFILSASLVLIIFGVITFKEMPIEAFPDVTNTEISVITQWPGRSAEEVEKFVTIPIELALNPVQQKISLRSTSIFGLSYVKLIFEDKVVDKDARAQVFGLLSSAVNNKYCKNLCEACISKFSTNQKIGIHSIPHLPVLF